MTHFWVLTSAVAKSTALVTMALHASSPLEAYTSPYGNYSQTNWNMILAAPLIWPLYTSPVVQWRITVRRKRNQAH